MIEVIRKNKETKVEEKYGFHLFADFSDRIDLVLNTYSKTLPKTEHAPRRLSLVYNRLSGRDSNMKEEEVIMPEDVIEEARQKLIDTIRILKWSEHRR